MKPTKGNLLIRPIEEESLLELPEEAKLKPMTGEIIAVGDNCSEFVGVSKIIYKKYAADEVIVEGEKLLIVREEDVLLIL